MLGEGDDRTETPVGKTEAINVEDHLRSALNATEDETVEYHLHTALQMLTGGER